MSKIMCVIWRNLIQVSFWNWCVNHFISFLLFFLLEREKVKSEVLKIESVLNNSSELHLSEFRCSSPILSAISCCSSGAAGTPGTPVDIKSVLQVRQLSCKKLIYSYTFGSNCADCGSNSSCDASPNFFTKSSAVSAAAAVVNRSPTTNCRQNFNKSSGQCITSNFEIANAQNSFKRKN